MVSHLGPDHTYTDIFLNSQIFPSGFKNFPVHTKRIQIEFACPHPSDGIQIHSSTQGSSAIKCVQSMRHKARDIVVTNMPCCCCCAVILVYFSVRELTRICYVIRYENIRIHPSTRYRTEDLFFPLCWADLKMSRFAVEFAGVRLDGSRIRKKKTYPDTCGWGLSLVLKQRHQGTRKWPIWDISPNNWKYKVRRNVYSQTKSSVPLNITLMNWLFEYWTR